MRDRQLLERIDACRPGSDDLHDPTLAPLADELAESRAARQLYSRVQSMDGAIQEALEDMHVPAGLSERLLARLAAEQVVSAAETSEISPEAIQASPSLDASRTSRRGWLAWSAGFAAAASIAAAIVVWNNFQPALTEDNIDDEVRQFADLEELEEGHRVEDGLPRGYPFSRYVYRMRGTTWRPVPGFLHRSELNGVAYDMVYRGTQATLYVVPEQVASLPSAPPWRLGMVTGNRAIAAWQENNLLYVLLVRGDERAYQTFIRRSPQA